MHHYPNDETAQLIFHLTHALLLLSNRSQKNSAYNHLLLKELGRQHPHPNCHFLQPDATRSYAHVTQHGPLTPPMTPPRSPPSSPFTIRILSDPPTSAQHTPHNTSTKAKNQHQLPPTSKAPTTTATTQTPPRPQPAPAPVGDATASLLGAQAPQTAGRNELEGPSARTPVQRAASLFVSEVRPASPPPEETPETRQDGHASNDKTQTPERPREEPTQDRRSDDKDAKHTSTRQEAAATLLVSNGRQPAPEETDTADNDDNKQDATKARGASNDAPPEEPRQRPTQTREQRSEKTPEKPRP